MGPERPGHAGALLKRNIPLAVWSSPRFLFQQSALAHKAVPDALISGSRDDVELVARQSGNPFQ